MNILSLDLSTQTGYAMFKDDSLVKYGTVGTKFDHRELGEYPFSYLEWADKVVEAISLEMASIGYAPDKVVIEETTGSNNNYSQKILEFIHMNVLRWLRRANVKKVYYIRTGVWRSIVGARQNPDERKLNAKIKRIKQKSGKKLAKIDGKVVGKKDRKDYAIRAAKDIFGIDFKKKDNNTVDAILVGWAFIKGGSVCDGTVNGGNLSSKE